MNFPRLVFRSAGEYLLAVDEAKFNQFLKEGWFESVPKAIDAANRDHDIARAASLISTALKPVQKTQTAPHGLLKGGRHGMV